MTVFGQSFENGAGVTERAQFLINIQEKTHGVFFTLLSLHNGKVVSSVKNIIILHQIALCLFFTQLQLISRYEFCRGRILLWIPGWNHRIFSLSFPLRPLSRSHQKVQSANLL